MESESPGNSPAEQSEPRAELRATPSSPFVDFLRRLRRSKFAILGGGVVGLVLLSALLAPLVAPYDPSAQNIQQMLQGPTTIHWLGTDELGRDTLSRVIYGARVSLLVGVIAVSIALFVGSALGLIAGYGRGMIDGVIMRVMDGLLAFPTLVLALAITAMLGPSLNNVMIAIGITGVPDFARIVRGQVLALRELDYVQAARSIGANDIRIMSTHILPNTMAPIIVHASIIIPGAILAEAGLSFLGLGVQPPTPSWGSMLNTARGYLEHNAWLAVAPGAAICITVLALNFLGDALRDTLDPRLR